MKINLEPIKKIGDNLFEGITIFDAINPLFLFIYFIIMKFVFIGIIEKFLIGYFEVLSSIILLLILGMLIPIKFKKYLKIVNFFIVLGGILYVLADIDFLIRFSMSIYGFFTGLLICYITLKIIGKSFNKTQRNNRPIIIRKWRGKRR